MVDFSGYIKGALRGVTWVEMLVALCLLVSTASCQRKGSIDAAIDEARGGWEKQMQSLRSAQAEASAQLDGMRAHLAADNSARAESNRLRAEAAVLSGQQTLNDGQLQIENVVRGIKTAESPEDALLEAQARMAAYFATEREALQATRRELAQLDSNGSRTNTGAAQ